MDVAIDAFRHGDPVCLFDADHREGETDLLFSGAHATPSVMRRLRQECGGLLFLAIGHEIGEQFGLPFLQDLHTDAGLVANHPVLRHLITNDLPYDRRSAFTLSLNHRETFTGITDRDRSLTTRRFAELAGELDGVDSAISQRRLGEEFRTPGHIPVCRETKEASLCGKGIPNSPSVWLDWRVRHRWSSVLRCCNPMVTMRFRWTMQGHGLTATASRSSRGLI